MDSVNKQVCPTCGQSVNRREIQLYSGMVKALILVYKWCKEHEVHEFQRSEVNHLMDRVEYTRFGDWVYFGGLIYRPEGGKERAQYGMHIGRVEEFLSGNRKIPTLAIKDPLSGQVDLEEEKYIHEIPHLTEFLNEHQQYIARYVGSVEI
jgi:hypothetical protein